MHFRHHSKSPASKPEDAPPPIPDQIIVTEDGKVREIERIGKSTKEDEERNGPRYRSAHGTKPSVLERMAGLA